MEFMYYDIDIAITITVYLLWPPCVADADIIFLPCGFFYLLLSFFSSPNLSRRRLDVCHTCTHVVSDIAIFVLKRDVKLQLTN